jgi:hypothetical protein
MVDVIGKLRPEVAKGIIGESREMQHTIKTDEIVDFDVPRVLMDGRYLVDFTTVCEYALRVQTTVQTDHLVASSNQHWRQHGPDVTQMSCHQNAHLVYSS